jgi:hypothetical protein
VLQCVFAEIVFPYRPDGILAFRVDVRTVASLFAGRYELAGWASPPSPIGGAGSCHLDSARPCVADCLTLADTNEETGCCIHLTQDLLSSERPWPCWASFETKMAWNGLWSDIDCVGSVDLNNEAQKSPPSFMFFVFSSPPGLCQPDPAPYQRTIIDLSHKASPRVSLRPFRSANNTWIQSYSQHAARPRRIIPCRGTAAAT